MKRILVFLFAIIAAASLAAETAIIQDMKGKVEIKALGGAWMPATKGMRLDILSTISTGFDSTAVLAIADNRVSVAPLTRLTIDKILAQAGSLKTNLNLRVGSVSAQVKSSAGIAQEFNVTSPYSTASVRGTQFTYDGLALDVREGRVAFIPGRPVRDILIPASVQQGPSQTGEAVPGGTTTGEGLQPGAPPAEGGSSQQGQEPAGSMSAAAFLTALQNEFQGDSFTFVDQSGQSVPQSSLAPPPQAGQAGGQAGQPGPNAPQPGAAPTGQTEAGQAGTLPPPPPQQAVFVGAGYSAMISIDFSAPSGPNRTRPAPIVGGAAALPPQGGGLGPAGPGPAVITPPLVRPSSGQTSGSISVEWN